VGWRSRDVVFPGLAVADTKIKIGGRKNAARLGVQMPHICRVSPTSSNSHCKRGSDSGSSGRFEWVADRDVREKISRALGSHISYLPPKEFYKHERILSVYGFLQDTNFSDLPVHLIFQ